MRLLLVLLFAGCGAVQHAAAPRPEIVAHPEGRVMSLEALADTLAATRIVYIGEEHDSVEAHEAQRAIVEASIARDPQIAIGLEMVQHPFQPALDAYIEGTIDEAELLRRVEWEDRWGFDFAMYRPIFELARAHRVPLVALNARAEITRTVGRQGRDALSPEQAAEVPELDLTDAAHRAMIEEALSGHPNLTPELLERFYTAQVIWDETMADRAARFVAEHDRRMIVLAGVMHVYAGLGIPERAARRGATPYAIVLPIRAAERADTEPNAAQYLWVIP
jgi:uncharacterized iron-regulated protein